MSKLSRRFPMESEWDEISAKLVRWHRLPNGSRFDLVYERHPTHGDRKVRRNLRVKRRRFARDDHPRVEDDPDIRVSEAISNMEQMLALNLKQRRMKIVAVGPDGSRLPGSTKMKTWRAVEPAPTPGEREERRLRWEEIDFYLRPRARGALGDIEELIEDPEMKVPHAVLLELAERFGEGVVRDAWQEVSRRL